MSEKTELITNAFFESECLYDFLHHAEPILGFHLGILDENLQDPSITNPPEDDRWYGELEPYKQLTIRNRVVGYLAVEKGTILRQKQREMLDLVAAFLLKMPEIQKEISYKDDAYVSAISELLFSRDNDRMVSLRAQMGLSGIGREDKNERYVIINIRSRSEKPDNRLQKLEYALRHYYLREKDVILHQQDVIILIRRISSEEVKTRKYAQELQEIVRVFGVILCISDPFSNPIQDFRMRQHFNCNEQVLHYLLDAYRNEEFLTDINFYDDWRIVSLLNAALACPGANAYGGQHYINQKVKNIIDYDKKNDTDYLATLYAYLNSNFSLNATASCLHVHRNTVVYRVKRMTELFDIDFGNANECFRLNMSCRIYKISCCIESNRDEKENPSA